MFKKWQMDNQVRLMIARHLDKFIIFVLPDTITFFFQGSFGSCRIKSKTGKSKDGATYETL
jgi:hypothetical protein